MKLEEEFLQTAGRSVDDLVSTEMRIPQLLDNILKRMYDAAVEERGGSLSLAAARSLIAEVEHGDTVLITTGAGRGHTNIPRGETDGPLGAVGLARALALGLGARPIIVAEDHCVDPIIATARAGGLNCVSFEEHQRRQNAVTVMEYTRDADEADDAAESFLRTYEPSALIAIEKGGPNRKGVYHSATGSDMTPGRAKIAPLFELGSERDVLTIGIGDNGNEIGFGRIEQAVRDIHPYGDVCKCSCEDGNACAVATDHLIVSNAANWGAYGIEAMLAMLLEDPDVLHSPEEEIRMLEQNVLAGSNDGMYNRPIMKVDTTSKETQAGIVAMLRDIVVNSQSPLPAHISPTR